MLEFRERRRIKRIIFSRPALGLGSLLAVLLVVQAGRMSFQAFQAREAKQKVEAEFQRLAQEKKRVEERIANLGSPEDIEREAKELFGVSQKGERVIIIVEPNEGQAAAAASSSGRFWNFIKNILR